MCELNSREGSSSYHLCGSAVLIIVIEVTLSIVGLDEASQPAVQSKVRYIVCGEHQQVVGLLSPTYLLLFTGHSRLGPRRDAFCILACLCRSIKSNLVNII